MVGELVNSKPGKQWTGQDGKTREPHLVVLLVGDRTVSVEYRDAAAAAGVVTDAQKGDSLALRVFVQSPKGASQVFYRGIVDRHDA